MEENIINLRPPRDFLPKQRAVLDAVKNKRHKYILYSGAFGAGKTMLLVHVVIQECIKNPKSLWFFGSQTVPMLRDTVVRTFLEECDLYQEELKRNKIEITLKKSYKPSIMSFAFFNGSEILFRSCDEPSKFKSLNLDGFAIDEPVDVDEQVFLMLQGRLRGKHTERRLGILAGNPSGKTNWVYRTFFENKSPEYFVVHTTSYENSFLPPDYIPSMEASYDDDYARRYLMGEWGSFEGLVYKDFVYDKHVGDFRNQKCMYHIAGFDDGYRNPACLLTLGVTSDNAVYVKDEIYTAGYTSTELAEEVQEKDKKYKYSKIFVDPSALNIIEIMKAKKLRVYEANNDLDSGVSKLKALFKDNYIHIDRSCKNLIKEIESYRYEKNILTKNMMERPIKKDDHAVDALRYAVTQFNPFKKPSFIGVGKW